MTRRRLSASAALPPDAEGEGGAGTGEAGGAGRNGTGPAAARLVCLDTTARLRRQTQPRRPPGTGPVAGTRTGSTVRPRRPAWHRAGGRYAFRFDLCTGSAARPGRAVRPGTGRVAGTRTGSTIRPAPSRPALAFTLTFTLVLVLAP